MLPHITSVPDPDPANHVVCRFIQCLPFISEQDGDHTVFVFHVSMAAMNLCFSRDATFYAYHMLST